MKYSEKFQVINQNLDYNEPPKSILPCSGGCIHDSNIWEFSDGQRFFVKYAPTQQKFEMLKAEHEALRQINTTQSVRCPTPILVQQTDDNSGVLVLEYLDLHPLKADSGTRLGHSLAELHQSEFNNFGFPKDNFIGATPQLNQEASSWVDFFWNYRLLFQFKLAAKNGFSVKASKSLEASVSRILEAHSASPRLLHGDLWGGNAGALPDGTPVVFDPASYYGDPETDLAFTEVFGGFPASFYKAYFEAVPLAEGYQTRKLIYNLYHYLNHLNLFGSGYLSNCAQIITTLESL